MEFGVACYADRPAPGSSCGYSFRIYEDGQLKYGNSDFTDDDNKPSRISMDEFEKFSDNHN